MPDLLEYLDSVSIDVVKRKYYNANKVNAVFEEIRSMAEALTEENRRLSIAAQAQSEEQKQAAEELSSLRNAYREALQTAHTRADRMIADATEESTALRHTAEARMEIATKQVEECLNALRVREEQNIDFINARMQRFLTALYDDDGVAAGASDAKEQEAGAESDDPLSILQSRVSALTSEIHALERET